MNEVANLATAVPPRPTTLRTLGLMLGLTCRMFIHRLGMLRRFGAAPPSAAPGRTATRRKRTGMGSLLLVFVMGSLLIQGAFLAFGVYTGAATAARPLVHPTAATQAAITALYAHPPVPAASLRPLLAADPGIRALPLLVRHAEEARWSHALEAEGPSAFSASSAAGHQPGAWTQGLSRILAGALGVLALALLLFSLGMGSQDLGQVEWNLLWLATMPVPMRALLIAKVAEYTLLNPLLLIVYTPLATIILFEAGAGWWSVLIALLCTLGVGLCLSALRLVIETTLRLQWPLRQIKNLQAGCTLLGTVLTLPMYAMQANPELSGWLCRIFQQLPLHWLPSSAPCWASDPALGGGSLIVAPVVVLLVGGAVAAAAIELVQWQLQGGLIVSSGAYQGRRGSLPATGPAAAPLAGSAAARLRPLGMAGKDLLLLGRDRNLLVQVVAMPVLLIGFQAVLNPGAITRLSGNVHAATATAFGVGAYVLTIVAMNVLSSEGQGLWLLYTAPRTIERILLGKCLVYALLAACYTAGCLIGLGGGHPWGALRVTLAAFAFFGIACYAVIIAAIGALAARPLEVVPQRKINLAAVYGSMLLIGMYGIGLFTDSLHSQLVQAILAALVAVALWQRVRDHVPYLLDPTAAPPPTISLGDGLIAILVFFTLQLAIGLLLATTWPELSQGARIGIAYALAGVLVGGLSLASFWRQQVPELAHRLGFLPRGPAQAAYARAVVGGILGGLACAGFAWIYLTHLLPHLPWLTQAKAQLPTTDGLPLVWAVLVLVVAAPLAEEYLFRGLLFAGLRRSSGRGTAVLGSAALFAIVHPTIAVVPVFVLGIVTSVVYEGSGLLLGSILVHALYNGLVLAMTPGR